MAWNRGRAGWPTHSRTPSQRLRRNVTLERPCVCPTFVERGGTGYSPTTIVPQDRCKLPLESPAKKTVRKRVFSIDAAFPHQLTCYMHARRALADSLLPPFALPHLRAVRRWFQVLISEFFFLLLSPLESLLARGCASKFSRMNTYEKHRGVGGTDLLQRLGLASRMERKRDLSRTEFRFSSFAFRLMLV